MPTLYMLHIIYIAVAFTNQNSTAEGTAWRQTLATNETTSPHPPKN